MTRNMLIACLTLLTFVTAYGQSPPPIIPKAGPPPFASAPIETPPLVMVPTRGQPMKVYRIAMLSYDTERAMDDLQRRLESVGLKQGVNVEYLRRAGGRDGDPASGAKQRTAEAVNEIVAWHPDLILQMNANAGVAIKENPATATIPVIGWSTYAVGPGFAKSYTHPGLNYTGFAASPNINLFYMRLLKETIPNFKHLGHLYNPGYAIADETLADLKSAAALMGVDVKVYTTLKHADFDKTIAKMKKEGMQAIHVGPHETFNVFGEELGGLALKYHLPAVGRMSITRGGGLATIDGGTSWDAAIPKIIAVLQGANPGDIPIERNFAPLVTLNLQTAKKLGLQIPAHLIDDADTLIE